MKRGKGSHSWIFFFGGKLLFMGISLLGDGPQGFDAHIQFETDQQYQRIDEDQGHEYDDRSDGAVQGVVPAEIVDKGGKTQGGHDAEKGCQDAAGRNQFPFFMNRRCVFINEGDGVEHQGDDEDPPHIGDKIPPEAAAQTKPFQHGALCDQQDQAAEYQAKDEGGEPDGHPAVVQAFALGKTDIVLVERTLDTHHGIGSEEQGQQQAKREETEYRRFKECIINERGDRVVEGLHGDQVLQDQAHLVQDIFLFNKRQVRYQGENKEEGRGDGHDEIVGDGRSPFGQSHGFDLPVKEFRHIIQRNAFEPGQVPMLAFSKDESNREAGDDDALEFDQSRLLNGWFKATT